MKKRDHLISLVRNYCHYMEVAGVKLDIAPSNNVHEIVITDPTTRAMGPRAQVGRRQL